MKSLSRKILLCSSSLALFGASLAIGQTPPAEALPKIQVPAELRKKGVKIRIRNKATGQAKTIDLGDEEFISSDAVRELMDPKTQAFKPEFAVLGQEEKRRPYNERKSLKPGMSPLTRSLVFDQPAWRQVGFKPFKTKSGQIVFKLDAQPGLVVAGATAITSVPMPTPDEASRRRALMEPGDIRKLFDIGWRSLAAHRYDLGYIAFGRLLNRKDMLSPDQATQAHLGHGISTFHQQGCGKIEQDFVFAEKNPKNQEDVFYYRGLCYVEAKRYPEADAMFKVLAQKNGSKYAESSRFFVGVVAENQERYEDAESAYMDTIDFASDKHIVSLAKTRLEAAKQARIQRDFARKWFTLALTGAAGWDSNVVGLPRSLAPADYSLKNKSSGSLLGLMYTEVKPPWTRSIDLKFKYTLLQLSYLSAEIKPNYNIRSHEIGTSVAFNPSDRDQVGLGISYNSILKATAGTVGEFMVTPAFEVSWQKTQGPLDAPVSDIATTFRVSLQRPRAIPSPTFDATANSYLLSTRYNMRHVAGHTFGPGLDIEYKPASGTEVSYYSASLLGKWDSPVGPESWEMYATQEGGLQYTPYYDSASKRKDTILKYSGAVARLMTSWMELRLQFVGTMSLSSQSTYAYNKAQFNLMVNAFF